MVAALKDTRVVLPLLAEPLKPSDDVARAWGWTSKISWTGRYARGEALPTIRRTWTRNRAHDTYGAFIQHIVVRYVVQGVDRNQLAAETSYSIRRVQAILSGESWQPYSQSVLLELERLGIGRMKGQRPLRYSGGGTREGEIVQAYHRACALAIDILSNVQGEGARKVVQTARLLTAGREPLRAP